MKKFKTVKLKKNKSMFFVLIICTFVLSLTLYTSNKMSKQIIETGNKIVKKKAIMAFKNAFTEVKKQKYDINKLTTVIKNSKDEIIEVDFNINECYTVLYEILEKLQAEFNKVEGDNYTGSILWIPSGYATKNPLFLNLGPKIPLKISLTETALGDVKTKITSYGVNNALIEIYLSFTLNIEIFLPLNEKSITLDYSSLLSSKIIAGQVPSFYNGSIKSESETINLPIN